ncbi:MAG: AAA family ATPase [Alphaproteobacteria bacterium]|nr:AAA family ATPase [Alphaproteobacteria bacterium]
MKGFPTLSPACLEVRPPARQWLVEALWSEQGVGIVGGEPKCGKSFLALDLAVAVAAGVPCLRRYRSGGRGAVLLFAAEDAGHIVRARLEGIAGAAGTPFEALDIAVIDAPTLRLDHRPDRQRLLATVERVKPRLLVLDPLVRLHGVDENAAGEIGPILGFLREIQRRFDTAVVLVHHARKGGAARPGQALRGSSELHAWGDSNLYLRRRRKRILLTAEHRAAPGLADIAIELADGGHGPALRLSRAGDEDAVGRSPEQRLLDVFAEAEVPLSLRELRERAALRTATVGAAVRTLRRQRRIEKAPQGGYRLAGETAGTANGEALPKRVTARKP